MKDGLSMAASVQARTASAPEWWRGTCLYEVYVRSFMDSDGDGEGDLRGLTARLDCLAHLGVDALRLRPIFPSAMFDSGCDVADYRAIDPRFGTLVRFVGAASIGFRPRRTTWSFAGHTRTKPCFALSTSAPLRCPLPQQGTLLEERPWQASWPPTVM